MGEGDLVFERVPGSYLDASALLRRYKAALERAGLRPLRFHDLRHTFGTRVIVKADIRRVQEWMGHADVQTTMRYLHYAPRHDDARGGRCGLCVGSSHMCWPPRRERRRRTASAVRKRLSASRQLRRLTGVGAATQAAASAQEVVLSWLARGAGRELGCGLTPGPDPGSRIRGSLLRLSDEHGGRRPFGPRPRSLTMGVRERGRGPNRRRAWRTEDAIGFGCR